MSSRALRLAGLLLALWSTHAAVAAEVELWWITAEDAWAVAADPAADSESFTTWLRNKDARKAAARDAEAWRAAMAQRDASPEGAQRWRDALVAAALAVTGETATIRRVTNAGNPGSHAGLALTPQRKGTRVELAALAVAVKAIVARDGRSFELELTVGERSAGSPTIARLRDVRYLSRRVTSAAAWDESNAYQQEIDAAATFAVQAALGRATPGEAAGRRVRESAGGLLVSEPIEQ